MSWDHMVGDDRVRFCDGCRKNVFNVASLTEEQLEALLRMPGDAPCLRVFRRADGHVLLGDCPVGATSARRRLRVLTGAAAAAATFAGACVAYAVTHDTGTEHQGRPATPMAHSSHDLETPDTQEPPTLVPLDGQLVMGAMVAVPDAPKPIIGDNSAKCACQAGDPLCTCLEQAAAAASAVEFDRGAAVDALSRTFPRVRQSVGARDTVFHVRVEFLPTGRVGNVTFDEPSDLSAFERTLVAQQLGAMRVPAFQGSPVTVGRRFEVQSKP
jgi:hypothetical protein